ncbi:hypothetical protein EG68_01016 [Paragonimus skrjabini miyazakii]|uniref:Uncharacterized protein n=1 Tax=Paragonimus skrjabini miyazakii TaxID=59628 RepID=A0A8S9Z859_9TREM|nr:hypothetical protein EG68_01016 [Paragonimus skrjabini miyazakii]
MIYNPNPTVLLGSASRLLPPNIDPNSTRSVSDTLPRLDMYHSSSDLAPMAHHSFPTGSHPGPSAHILTTCSTHPAPNQDLVPEMCISDSSPLSVLFNSAAPTISVLVPPVDSTPTISTQLRLHPNEVQHDPSSSMIPTNGTSHYLTHTNHTYAFTEQTPTNLNLPFLHQQQIYANVATVVHDQQQHQHHQQHHLQQPIAQRGPHAHFYSPSLHSISANLLAQPELTVSRINSF